MRAQALKRYLENSRKIIYARLISASQDGDAEIIELEVDVDLPQRPLYPIKPKERLRIRFPKNDSIPQVFALRKNFPLTPHTSVNGSPYPRQLCLYERHWADERSSWAPRPFVERIRHWFTGTADGTLHLGDQPLEPLMQHTLNRIVLPAIPFVPGAVCRVERFYLSQRNAHLWSAHRQPPADVPTPIAIPVLIVQGPTVHHGIMHKLPVTLGELEALLAKWGGSLVQPIAKEMGRIRDELKPLAHLPLLLVLELPKTRQQGGNWESVEHRSFFVGKNIGELFGTHIEQVKEGRLYVPKKQENFTDPARLDKVPLDSLSVQWHLTATSAAAMNGYSASSIKVLAIGAGALGSPLITNLWRGGFGDWTVVDGDELEPHNPARHQLNSDAVGLKKAEALTVTLGAVFPDRPPPHWVACDYLSPGGEREKLETFLQAAELILDLSASVTVERGLAVDSRASARRMTAFLNQRGDESVLLAEDATRTIDLFWLEAEYYRAAILDPRLRGHFEEGLSVGRRYGNGCREISAVVPQESVALHAALLSKAIRLATGSPAAAVRVFRASPLTGAVTPVDIAVATPFIAKTGDWRIFVHPQVLRDLSIERQRKLPVETGGILIGVIERTQRAIAIIGMMPAPLDSNAWPTSFIRGSNGLVADVERARKRSAGNVGYVGEWHSHPNGCGASPSAQDFTAIGLCATDTRADGVPTLMLIAADEEFGLVFLPIDSDKPIITNISLH